MIKDLDSVGINLESGSFYDAKVLVAYQSCDGQKIQTLETIQVEKNQKVIITVLDEFVEEMPAMKGRSARGLLSEYADTELWDKEKTAWEKAVAEKYADA